MSKATNYLVKVEVDADRIESARTIAERHVESVSKFRMVGASVEVEVAGAKRTAVAADVHQLWLTGTVEQLFRAGVALTQAGIFHVERSRKALE